MFFIFFLRRERTNLERTERRHGSCFITYRVEPGVPERPRRRREDREAWRLSEARRGFEGRNDYRLIKISSRLREDEERKKGGVESDKKGTEECTDLERGYQSQTSGQGVTPEGPGGINFV